MKNSKIAFDLDGVVYDFVRPFDKFMKNNGFPLKDETKYNIEKRYNIARKEGFEKLDDYGKTRPFLTIPLYERAKMEMERLVKHYELYIITHRDWSKFGIEDTIKRVKNDELPVDRENIIFAKNKGDWAKKLDVCLFYEDSMENANDILNKSNSLVAIINTPYNKGNADRIVRIDW